MQVKYYIIMHETRQLEKTAHLLDPDATQRERLLNKVIDYTNDYMEEIAGMPAHIMRSDNGRPIYDSPITEEGIDIREALALLQENVNTVGLNPTSGRFVLHSWRWIISCCVC